jgi:FKBP-type peptidyl-prolyl cis-trans isomerase FkpA
VGVTASESFRALDLSPAELEVVRRGLRDAMEGMAAPVDPALRARVDALSLQRRGALERRLVERWAAEPGATREASGLVWVPVVEGDGASPGPEDVVKVQYVGRLADGTVFDDTARKGAPAAIPLDRVIPCWKQAVPRLKVGGKARVACPPALAYGDRGMGRAIPPGATLFFEIELVSIPARVVTTDVPIPGTIPPPSASSAPPPPSPPSAVGATGEAGPGGPARN